MELVNIDIRYLWNVYLLKMTNLVSFELILGNNVLDKDGLILLSKGLNNLSELKWIVFDLVGNEITDIGFYQIFLNL